MHGARRAGHRTRHRLRALGCVHPAGRWCRRVVPTDEQRSSRSTRRHIWPSCSRASSSTSSTLRSRMSASRTPSIPGEYSATIGGNIATNAGGMQAVKHGVTRHHVLGLELALATGEVIRTGGRVVKASSGYDLTQLVIGSEGTLALVTEATLKLVPRPAFSATVLRPVPDARRGRGRRARGHRQRSRVRRSSSTSTC